MHACACVCVCGSYAAGHLNRVKTTCHVANVLTYFWWCVLTVLPSIMDLDVSGVTEYGPTEVVGDGDYVRYYLAAWDGRVAAGGAFDVVLIAPHVFALAYIIFMDQVGGRHAS